MRTKLQSACFTSDTVAARRSMTSLSSASYPPRYISVQVFSLVFAPGLNDGPVPRPVSPYASPTRTLPHSPL